MKLREKIDNLIPDPWYVDGVKQERPMVQFVFIVGVIVGLLLLLIHFWSNAL